MKVTQAQSNPYPFSDSNKRYFTYEYYLRRTFGGKCAKIPLDAGFTCPNIDGRCGRGGCIYCSGRGSGDFAQPSWMALEEQYRRTREALSHKWSVERCIPYFQAHTNTYAPAERLRELFLSAAALPGAVGVNVATRADCLPADVLTVLREVSERTHLTVELGLQTAHDDTAARIHRGHDFSTFCCGYMALREACPQAEICVHLIFGLPGEDTTRMCESVQAVAKLAPDQVKLHLLHVLRGTELARQYLAGDYVPMEEAAYVDTVVRALEQLPPTTVIGRLTGDGMADELLAPLWSRRKIAVINNIDKCMVAQNTYQGRLYRK